MKKIYGLLLLLILGQVYGQADLKQLEQEHVFQEGKEKVTSLLTLSRRYYQIDLDRSKTYAELAREYSQKIGFKEGELKGIMRMALALDHIGKYEEAFGLLWEAELLASHLADHKTLVSVNQRLAGLYKTIGDLTQALKHLYRAKEIVERHSLSKPAIYTNIGIVYEELGDKNQAERFYDMAIKRMKQRPRTQREHSYYREFGKVLTLAKHYEDALGKLDSALFFYHIVEDLNNIAKIKFWQGRIFYNLGLFEQAKKISVEAILIREQRGDLGLMLPPLLLSANIHLKEGRNQDAIVFFDKGLTLSQELGIFKELPAIYEGMSKAYENQNKQEKAFQYYQHYIQFRDSLSGIQKALQLRALQLGFDMETHEQERKRLLLENRLKEEIIQKYLIGFTCVGLFLIWLFIRIARMSKTHRRSKADYQVLFESVDEGILILEKQMIVDCNQRAADFWGRERESIVGLQLQELSPGYCQDPESYSDSYGIDLEEEMIDSIQQFQWKVPGLHGPSIWIEISLSTFGREEENKMMALCRDITDRKESKRRLEQEWREKNALINNTSDFIWSIDSQLRVLSFNEPFAKIVHKLSGKQLLKGEEILSYTFKGEFKEKRHAYYLRALEGETFTVLEFLPFFDGGRFVNISYNPIMEGEFIVGVSCFLRNVTEQILSQQALKESEERYRTQMERISDAFIAFDTDWNYSYVNKKASEIMGYDPLFLLGKKVWELFPEASNQTIYQSLIQAQSDQIPRHLELFDHQEGKWYENFVYPSQDGVSLFYRDITEQKNNSRLAEESQKQFELIFNSVSETMILVRCEKDEQFLLETANVNLLEMLGREKNKAGLKDIIGVPISVFGRGTFMINEFHPYDMLHEKMQEAVSNLKAVPYLINSIRDNKREVYELTITPIAIENSCSHLLIVIHDFTDRFDEEERIIQEIYQALDKERTRIAREIHDNLTQTLSIASLNLKNLPYDFPGISEESKFNKSLQYLELGIDESRHLAHRIMPKAIEDFGLISSVAELIENTRDAYELAIQFDYDKTIRLPQEYELNLFRIIQESINNIVNHAEASSIDIELIIDNSYIHLEILDDGKGFDASKMNTIKSGIGIKSMKSRVHQLDGMLHIYSKPKKGTRVVIHIPLNSEHLNL